MPTLNSYLEHDELAVLYLGLTVEVLPLHKAVQHEPRPDRAQHKNHSARLVSLK